MAKASPIIAAFNSGELSPMMAGRVDSKFYPTGCKKLLNFIPTVQGPVRRRPGTRFVGEVKDSADRTWLKRFVFNQDQSYMLEFGDYYIRFYTDGALIMSGMSPLEITTPFSAADLTNDDGTFRLKFYQSNDVLYIASGLYPVQKLTRTGAASFTIDEMVTKGGPFQTIDPDQTISVYASAISGTGITLTASAALFTAAHVGTYMLLEQSDNLNIKPWTSGKSYTLNQIVRANGMNYKCLTGGTNTGTERPAHTKGIRDDGKVDWEYMDSGYGWVEITGYTSSTVVTATVIQQLPGGAVGSSNATKRWAFSMFSDIEGWPDNISSFRERLVLSRGLQLAFSVVGDFEDFDSRDDAGVVVADAAIRIDITSDEANNITWMAPMSSAFLVGTSGEEFAIREISTSSAFGPGNVRADRQTRHGSNRATPVVVGAGVVYAHRAGRKMRDMVLAESVDVRWASADLTVLADHITKHGVVSIAYQQEPDSIVWCARADGHLLGFTLNREQEVRAWHPHRIGGYSDAAKTAHAVVECVETLPTDEQDELWMIVRRNIGGANVRYIERMGTHFNAGDDIEDAFYVDSGLSLDNSVNSTLTPGTGANVEGSLAVSFTAGSAVFSAGDVGKFIYYRYQYYDSIGDLKYDRAIGKIVGYTSATVVTADIWRAWPNLSVISANGWRKTSVSVSGIDHLDGETVSISGDGAVYPDSVPASGALTVDWPLSKAHIGLPYKSVVTTMPIEAAAADGTAQGKTKRAARVVARFDNTVGAKYGATESGILDEIPVRDINDLMDAGPEPFTGDLPLSWPDGYSTDLPMTVIQDLPMPCTLVALMPQVHTQDNR